MLGVASLVLVAIYPFMKRVTWWPQLFLGLAFSWGALVGWTSQTGTLGLPPLLLYVGCILWTIGYDTIYALQDIEDDALIGVKSTARLFGRRARLLVALFYAGAVVLWLVAACAGRRRGLAVPRWHAGGRRRFSAGRCVTLDAKEPGNALVRFKANHWVGLALDAGDAGGLGLVKCLKAGPRWGSASRLGSWRSDRQYSRRKRCAWDRIGMQY